MATDPAWFYSTLAQSSAAIVGLIGGILGSRMLVHLQQLAESRRLLSAAVMDTQRWLAERRRDLQGFRDPWEKARAHAAAEPKQGIARGVAEPQGWIGNLSMRLVDVNAQEFLQTAAEVLALLDEFARLYAEPTGGVDAQAIRDRVRGLRQALVLPRVADPGLHEAHAARLELLGDQLEKYRAALVPQSFLPVLVVLAWITVTGVVAPLIFLPALTDGWSKAALLGAFAIGVVGLMAAFGMQLSQLRRMGDLTWLTPNEYSR